LLNRSRFVCIHPGHQSELTGGLHSQQDRHDLINTLVFTPNGFDHPKPTTTLEVEA
jgi:hypothetical protein